MRKRNWQEYNKELVKRGSITFFIDPNLLKSELIHKKQKGRPRIYTHPLIQMLLILKIQFHLTYRSLEGFSKSVFPAEIRLPSYSIICRRAIELLMALPKLSSRRPSVILLDSSGIKVYGEGEWKVKIHGKSKRRKWMKIHVAVDEKTQEIIALEVSNDNIADCQIAPSLIDKCPKTVKTYKGDGGYDTRNVRDKILSIGAKGLIPPRKNARRTGQSERDKALAEIKGLGGDLIARSLWGKLTGYSKRSLVESSFSRLKRIYGNSFFSRNTEKQSVEAHLKCYMMNKMFRKAA